MKHKTRLRAGRYQCVGCRAAWATKEAARKSKSGCPDRPLPHGHPNDRQHIVFPTWAKETPEEDRGEVDPLCDDGSCPCSTHKCDCHVCTETIDAPRLKILLDSHEGDDRKLTHTDREDVHAAHRNPR